MLCGHWCVFPLSLFERAAHELPGRARTGGLESRPTMMREGGEQQVFLVGLAESVGWPIRWSCEISGTCPLVA